MKNDARSGAVVTDAGAREPSEVGIVERVAMAIADACEPWRLGTQKNAKKHYFELARAAIEMQPKPSEDIEPKS